MAAEGRPLFLVILCSSFYTEAVNNFPDSLCFFAENRRGGAMKRILIVDDETHVLEALKSTLERQQEYSVTTARDGEEALKKMEAEIPDLIILDLMLPKIKGEELLGLIRNNIKTLNTPVIISTVKREVSSMLNLMKLGATDYLMKPYDFGDLRDIIKIYI